MHGIVFVKSITDFYKVVTRRPRSSDVQIVLLDCAVRLPIARSSAIRTCIAKWSAFDEELLTVEPPMLVMSTSLQPTLQNGCLQNQ